jgi:hypothetical protein
MPRIDSLARARLMFGAGKSGGETSARVITSIYNQMSTFYGQGFFHPIVEAMAEMLKMKPPSPAPTLPFDEDQAAHDLGVDPAFWVGLERAHFILPPRRLIAKCGPEIEWEAILCGISWPIQGKEHGWPIPSQ